MSRILWQDLTLTTTNTAIVEEEIYTEKVCLTWNTLSEVLPEVGLSPRLRFGHPGQKFSFIDFVSSRIKRSSCLHPNFRMAFLMGHLQNFRLPVHIVTKVMLQTCLVTIRDVTRQKGCEGVANLVMKVPFSKWGLTIVSKLLTLNSSVAEKKLEIFSSQLYLFVAIFLI